MPLQFLLGYPIYLITCLCFLLGGCMTLPEMPSETEIKLEQKLSSDKPAQPIDDKRIEFIGRALSFIGIPYRWGGNNPKQGFDCSGLVQYSLNDLGINTPRTAAEQQKTASKKNIDELLPGDLIFFRIKHRRTDHVAIYVGGGDFIHSPKPGQAVRTESLHQGYWKKRFVGVGSYL